MPSDVYNLSNQYDEGDLAGAALSLLPGHSTSFCMGNKEFRLTCTSEQYEGVIIAFTELLDKVSSTDVEDDE